MTLKYIIYNEDIKRPYLKILTNNDLHNPPFFRNRGSIQLYILIVKKVSFCLLLFNINIHNFKSVDQMYYKI